MKTLVLLLLSLLSFNLLSAEKLDADQLKSLSDCDYFKYTECTGAGLNIGDCVKKKYDGFSKACGKVHTDKFIYSREMFQPKVAKSKKVSCESAQAKLCEENGMSLSSCAAKYKTELGKACGDDFLKIASENDPMDECFKLRLKFCPDGITNACDAQFEAAAPAKCGGVAPSKKPGKEGAPSEASMVQNCMGDITSKCSAIQEELTKDGADTTQVMRKYQVCIEKALKSSKSKCGAMFKEPKIK